MSTIKAKLKLHTDDEDKIVHLETNSEQVLHSDTNVATILNSVITTDDISDYMQGALNYSGPNGLCRLLKVYRNSVFDECGLTWETYGEPLLQNNALVLDGASYIYKSGNTNYISFGSTDFTFDFKVTPFENPDSLLPKIFYARAASGFPRLMFDFQHNTKKFRAYYRESNTADIYAISTSECAYGNTYQLQLGYDSAAQKMYLFLDGVLQESIDVQIANDNYIFGIGANNESNSNFLIGSIHEFRFSRGICRNKTSFTPPTEPYEVDEFCTSLLHFD